MFLIVCGFVVPGQKLILFGGPSHEKVWEPLV